MPKVSVCIPSYNHERYIGAALDSVLAQTFRDFEVIVVDDGSTDGTLQIARSYASRYPRLIQVFTHPNGANRGISTTWNLTMEKSSGEYLACMGSDDVWLPEKLEIQVAQLDRDHRVGLVYSPARLIDENGQPKPNKTGGLVGVNIAHEPNPLLVLIEKNVITSPVVMFRRRCITELGYLDEPLIYSDWELFIRILARWEAGFHPEPLLLYRIHGTNVSARQSTEVKLQRYVQVMQAVREKMDRVGGRFDQPRVAALVYLQLAYFHAQLGNETEARSSFSCAYAHDPTLRRNRRFLLEWFDRQCRSQPKPIRPMPRGKMAAIESACAAVEHYRGGRVIQALRMGARAAIHDPLLWLSGAWGR